MLAAFLAGSFVFATGVFVGAGLVSSTYKGLLNNTDNTN